MAAGILSKLAFGLESAWGTSVTANKALAVHPGDGIQTDNDIQFISALKGQIAKNSDAFIGKRKHEGEFEVDFVPVNIAYFMKSLFGSVASVQKGGDVTVYDHTFSENATHPSLTIQQDVGDIIRKYAGAIVTSMKLSGKTGEPVVGTFGVKAKTSATSTTQSPTNETARPFNFSDILQASGFKIGSTYFPQTVSFELEYANNVEFLHSLGSQDPSYNYAKGSEVKGKFEMYLDSTSLANYTDFIAGTKRAIQIVMTGDAIGGSSNYKLDITIPNAIIKAASYPYSDDYTKLVCEFEGMYDTGSSKLITPVLTNLLTAIT